MTTVKLKGLHTATAKGRKYYYAWKGGPRVIGELGSPEFMRSYSEALASRRPPDDNRMRALVTLYKGSPAYAALADSTKRNWSPWLDRITAHFGDLRVAQFDRTERIRPVIRQWRNKWAAQPRTADYGLQVLSRVLSHGVDLDKLTTNPCDGIKGIYKANRAAIIWTPADIEAIKKVAPAEVCHVIDLAAHTGLRAGDLSRLCWSHVGDTYIRIQTGKSGQTVEAIIPLYQDLKDVLARIPKRSTSVLTTAAGRPWAKVNGSSFSAAKDKALPDRDLHFHDLRGTAATRFYIAGIKTDAIAEMMGWERSKVEKIIRVYVDREANARAMIRQLDEAGKGTE